MLRGNLKRNEVFKGFATCCLIYCTFIYPKLAPGDAQLSLHHHTQFLKRPAAHSKVFSPFPNRELFQDLHQKPLRGGNHSGLLACRPPAAWLICGEVCCHAKLQEERFKKHHICRSWKRVAGGYTTGATWLQQCREVTEKERNLSTEAASCYRNLDQWNIHFH